MAFFLLRTPHTTQYSDTVCRGTKSLVRYARVSIGGRLLICMLPHCSPPTLGFHTLGSLMLTAPNCKQSSLDCRNPIPTRFAKPSSSQASVSSASNHWCHQMYTFRGMPFLLGNKVPPYHPIHLEHYGVRTTRSRGSTLYLISTCYFDSFEYKSQQP